jgi:lysozyme family protein
MTRDQAIGLMLRLEGGYVDDPHDPGGATKYGITQRTLDSLQKKPLPVKLPPNVHELTPDEATVIYQSVQWYEIHGDSLPGPLAVLMLNAAVNMGETRAVTLLQATLGLKVDHIMGPATLDAVVHWKSAYMPEQTVAEEFAARCACYYAELNASESSFELGWFRRLFRVYTLAVLT